MIFHPFDSLIEKPLVMNNPFYYQPNDLCIKIQQEIVAYLQSKKEWHSEISAGKMFGFLIVERCDGSTGYLAAFSGQIDGKEHHDFFVPPIFDYLQENGYFKTKEKEIENINHQISNLKKTFVSDEQQSTLTKNIDEINNEIAEYKHFMNVSKANRDTIRLNTNLSESENQKLIAESQFQKAELKRLKKKLIAEQQKLTDVVEKNAQKIEQLKEVRKQMSANLQNYLFSNFVIINALGESKNLIDIFKDFNNIVPPAGSGECCAPKLLQYAYSQHYKPLYIAEFWWGNSPVGELRKHLNFYPACSSKCKPILDFMLKGLNIVQNPLNISITQDFETVFEDNYIAVVNKPAGMLSVPGKSNRQSVASIAKIRFGSNAMVVHRLDMATSGLIVVAKNLEIYKKLQKQFLNHDVKKVYYAVLSGEVTTKEGVITLPMIADINDRPRQKVDYQYGKPSETEYKVDKIENNKTYIFLYPKTGRTHQLRVHCAYIHGLNHPIIGDELYGTKSDRMYLHAQSITFTHPITKKIITITSKANF